jgi:cell division septal protein FtsQ
MIKKFIVITLLLSGWWSSRGWITAKSIECYTQYGLCSEEISQKLSWLIHTPLLFPLPQKTVARDLSSLSQVKSTRLHRRLPDTLVVSVDLRKPLGVIGVQVLGVKAVADEDGVIIGLQANTQLPQLLVNSPPSEYKFGDRLDQFQSQSLKMLATVSRLSGKQVLGRLDGTRLEVALADSTQVLFDLKYLEPNWPRTLQLILDRSKIQAKVPKTIDLRFSSPILTF